MDTTIENTAYIKIQSLGFLKNNEYYGPIADGYTLFGYQFNPQVGYKFSKYFSLEGGVFFNKDFGNIQFNEIAPTFTFKYIKNDFKMLFGNLDGSINHKLIEPIYNFERVMTNRLEHGLQFILTKKLVDFDIWMDWKKMSYRNSGFNEQFWLGISSNILKLKKNNLAIEIPFQSTINHSGGQLNLIHEPFYQNINYATGVKIQYNFFKKNLQHIYFDTRFVEVRNSKFDTIQTKNSISGGVFANIGLTAFKTNFIITYWYAKNFVNDFGGFVYSSASTTVWNPRAYETYRSILFLRINKKIQLAPHVVLTLRAEPHLDINLKWFEYSYGFYLSIDEGIWLKKK